MSNDIECETPAPIPPPDPVPAGMLNLLEAQLGEALKIMRDFSAWIHHPEAPIHECIQVSGALVELMASSGRLVKTVSELGGPGPETRHRMIVEYANGGRGSRKPENE